MCGAPIRFGIGSSIVVICPNCHSVVARGDRKLEDLGKVAAALVDTGSPLTVGPQGKISWAALRLDRSTAIFPTLPAGLGTSGTPVFPAISGGGWRKRKAGCILTFESPLPPNSKLSDPKSIAVGESITIPGAGTFVADEVGEGVARSAEGEIPYRLTPGETVVYVDLTGRGGRFATLDFSDTAPKLYLGAQVSLDAVGIPHAPAVDNEPKHVPAIQINCPQCGGVLDLRAPDAAERVACPYCHALLDCTQGKLVYLETLKPGKWKPLIPLGTVGTLDGNAYIVIGFLERHVTIERVNYYWSEYLLYASGVGFRWLVESDRHWSFVTGVPAGDVSVEGHAALYGGRAYRLFQQSSAFVDYVVGEFFWKVSIGESVVDSDYIHPPYILSREISFVVDTARNVQASDHPGTLQSRGEVNWSAGVYITPDELVRAFKLPSLPPPKGVAPNQPFAHKKVYFTWGVLAGGDAAVWILLGVILPSHKVLEQSYNLDPPTAPEQARTVFEHELKIEGHRSVRISVSAPVNNSWLYVDGDLFNEESDRVQPFSVPVEYYHGVDADGSWSEGESEPATLISQPCRRAITHCGWKSPGRTHRFRCRQRTIRRWRTPSPRCRAAQSASPCGSTKRLPDFCISRWSYC